MGYPSDSILTHLPPSATYMCQWIALTLVEIMACRLFGAKQLSKPMLGYCQLDPKEQILTKIQNFSFTKMHLEISSGKWRPSCLGGDELNYISDIRWYCPLHRTRAGPNYYAKVFSEMTIRLRYPSMLHRLQAMYMPIVCMWYDSPLYNRQMYIILEKCYW